MKLRQKFFVIFSILAIIPLIIVTCYSYWRYEQTTYDRMDEFSENLFQNAQSEAENILQSVQQAISLLTFNSDWSDYSVVETLKTFAGDDADYTSYDIYKANQYCEAIFQNVMFSYDTIRGIYLFTPSGVQFSVSYQESQLSSHYTFGDQKWVRDTLALEGDLYLCTFTSIGMFTDSENSIYFSKALYDVYTHEYLGILLLDYDPSIFDLSNVNSMPEINLLSISSSNSSEVYYSNIDELSNDIQTANSVVRTAELSLASLKLTAVFNYSELFKEFNVTAAVLLVVSTICAALFIIIMYFCTKYLVRPIENLSFVMSQQRGKELSFSSPYINRKDEIGTLYNEYANMLEELDSSIKRDYRDQLIILDAQMKSLEARINSHFLFNTLESINSIAELNDNEEIATMSLALGNMFRYSIKTESELVPLQDEIQNVQDYVSIQRIRFSNRFRLELNIAPELYEQRVLKLILQPLVENSLYHGLNYCSKGNLIAIHASISDSILYLNVQDNGQGMSEDTLRGLREKLDQDASFTELGHRTKQTIGLKNIHSRIELYYGKGYGLQLESILGEGTTITIRIPVPSDK
ncbi:MAG: sensor histidine kinase [Lachnospiraceae bacterium]|nr:sensor histidine kinase [Lachnospiraceae bacterium]